MIGATVIFGSNYTLIQILGASGAVLTIVQYSRITIQEKAHSDERTDMLPLVNNSAS